MTANDRLTEALGAELRAHADDLPTAPLTFEGVRGRARSIRRRRRAAATGAVAAAVALAVAVPTLLGAGTTGSQRPQPAPEPGRTVQVLQDGTLTLGDGSPRELGTGPREVSQLGVLTDGRVVVANQARNRIEVHPADGGAVTSYAVDYLVLRMSADDRLAAWVGRDSRIRVLESGVAEPVSMAPVPLPGESSPVVDAVVGSDCAGGGCRVLAGDGSATTSSVTVDAAADLAPAPELRVSDVSRDGSTWAVAFPPRPNAQYGCVGLYDVASAQVTARTCRTYNLQLSPDGEHLTGSFYENNMTGEVTVLDRDLRVVRTYDPARRVVVRAAWDDAAHVVASVADLDGRRWRLERVDIRDGSTTTLDGPTAGGNPEIVSEYVFPG